MLPAEVHSTLGEKFAAVFPLVVAVLSKFEIRALFTASIVTIAS